MSPIKFPSSLPSSSTEIADSKICSIKSSVKAMFLFLILLASSILVPGQSALSEAQVALHGENYSKLVNKMNEFDKQHVAPLIKLLGIGGCNSLMKIKDVMVGVDGSNFDGIQRRCETAVVLHKAMGEIRKHKHDVEKMERKFTEIKVKVLLYDVHGLEWKLFSHFGNKSEVVNKLRDVILKARDEGTGDHTDVEGKQRTNLKNAFQKALEAFEKNRSYETAYTMVYGAGETGKAMNWTSAEGLEWAMDTFKADLLVYDFLLGAKKTQEEKKPSGHAKLDKKHPSGHHGVMEQANAKADEPETA